MSKTKNELNLTCEQTFIPGKSYRVIDGEFSEADSDLDKLEAENERLKSLLLESANHFISNIGCECSTKEFDCEYCDRLENRFRGILKELEMEVSDE